MTNTIMWDGPKILEVTPETRLKTICRWKNKKFVIRDATQEEQDYVQGYIDSISYKTKVHF